MSDLAEPMAMFLLLVLLLAQGGLAVEWSSPVAALLETHTGIAGTASTDAGGLEWAATWGHDGTTFAIVIEAHTTGWVGFGLAEAAGMRGADILMGFVDEQGAAHVGDYHAIRNGTPLLDGCQDWNVHYGEEEEGWTLIVASRKLLTEDSNDRPILLTGLKRFGILAAHGPNDKDAATGSLGFHGSNKRKIFVDLETGASSEQEAWGAAKAGDATLASFDLKVNEASIKENFRSPVEGGQLIPTARTTYWDYCFKEQAGWTDGEQNHMVGFEALEDGSPANVHHFVLSGYSAAGCEGTETTVWVGGVGFYEDLPSGAGLSLTRIRSFKLNVHYDNPDGKSGLRDNSGVRVWTSSVAPEHEVGVLQLGDSTVQLNGQTIPAGRSFYEFSCPGEVTNAFPFPITVFASILHMHQQGDQMYTEVIRADGDVVERPNSVEYFDFAFQDPTLVQPYTIHPGDSLTTRCYYDNDAPGELTFGLGSEQEMCIDFLYFYPYSPLIKEHCTFGHGNHFGGSFDGSTIITDSSDPGMRVFGVDVGTPDDPTCTGGGVRISTAAPVTTSEPSASPTTTEPSVAPTFAPSSVNPTTSGPVASPTAAPSAALTANPDTSDPTSSHTNAPSAATQTLAPSTAIPTTEVAPPTSAPTTTTSVSAPTSAPTTTTSVSDPTSAPTTMPPTFAWEDEDVDEGETGAAGARHNVAAALLLQALLASFRAFA